MASAFVELISERWACGHAVSVGLDSDARALPTPAGQASPSQREFNANMVDATADLASAYKINLAFYLNGGVDGFIALQETVTYARRVAPGVAIILDAKFGDIGNTNEAYSGFAYDLLGVDAVTVNPYVGREALRPFLDREDKGAIVLCRTSNPGAAEFQGLRCQHEEAGSRPLPLYCRVAHAVACDWNVLGNCGLVVGGTAPEELREVRGVAGSIPILIPGVGAQGGDLEATVAAGRGSRGPGIIVNASRSVIFASGGEDYARAARAELTRLDTEVHRFLEREPAEPLGAEPTSELVQ
ncbi:MAG: orotidine-5'-phosphate decarboxylase [Acidimicrobiales bacterium]